MSCPAVKKSNNKWYCVTQQACSTCGRAPVLHVPENCNGTTRRGLLRTQTQATAATGISVWQCAPAGDSLRVNDASKVHNNDPLTVPTHLTQENNTLCRQRGVGVCGGRRGGLQRRSSAGAQLLIGHPLQSSNIYNRNIETKIWKATRIDKKSFPRRECTTQYSGRGRTCGHRMRSVLLLHMF